MQTASTPGSETAPPIHAEAQLLSNVRRTIPNHVLAKAIVYCSDEPCVLCASEIVRSPIRHVVYGRPAAPFVGGESILRAKQAHIRVEGPFIEVQQY